MKKLYASLATLICVFSASFVIADANQWQGQPVPAFKLQDQDANLVSNKDLKGKWTVLYFYPKDKTPGCTIEAQKFTDDYTKYKKIGTQIIGVSYDDIESHKDFAETYEMKFKLLADVDKSLGKAMKVHRVLPWPHTARQTFIVNPQGVIVKHYKDVSPKSHSAELLTDLKALQKL